jgi:hypothetical protein
MDFTIQLQGCHSESPAAPVSSRGSPFGPRASTFVYKNDCRLLDLRKTLHGQLAPHPSNGSHFNGEFVMLGSDLGERKSEKGLSGLIN